MPRLGPICARRGDGSDTGRDKLPEIYHQLVKGIQYRYSPLRPGNDTIRLLRLIPNRNEAAIIKCELLDYSLEPGQGTHLYEALSYVWGDPNEIVPIFIDNHILPITTSLYAALLRFRNRYIARTIWVDAVCINQEDEREKEQQIRLMAKIYSQANRVLVWLGGAADNSDQALEEIRVVGSKKATNSSANETIQAAVIALFQRPWFRRIWVLQEVATARNVLIMCGAIGIDGYAFCLGVDSLKEFYEAPAGFQSMIRSVIYLIRGAIFRPNYVAGGSGIVSQDICTLGELVDMYHTHKATKRHDKVYALLGMSSDGLSERNLSPNYAVPWEELLQRLSKFLLGEEISVQTWSDKEVAVIKSKGCILGEVSSVLRDTALDDRQSVEVIFKNTSGQPEYMGVQHWTLRPSAKPIEEGDFICLLQGASKPAIIRLRRDYFVIIIIAVTPLESIRMDGGYIEWSKLLQSVKLFTRDFLLFWNWGSSPEKLQDPGEYEILIGVNSWALKYPKTDREDHLDKATKAWNVALILGDLKKYEEAEERRQEAIEGYKIVFEVEHRFTPKSRYGLTPLSWAAGNGHDDVVHLLLVKDGVDPDLKDSQYGQTPLSFAAERGHEAVVELLLETGKVEVNMNDRYGRTPLSFAAERGHEVVVELLLETGKIDIDVKDQYGQTPLWHAAKQGHEAVVKLLLQTGKVEVNMKDGYNRTPLSFATERGHEAVVKLLLKTGNVEVDARDSKYGRTPLWHAAVRGHEAVVKLLLETGKVEVDMKDKDGQTPFRYAVEQGHEAVVKLRLETVKVKVDVKDKNGRTPLSFATERGHEAVVKLLLKTGKVDVDVKDKNGRTPLSFAASGGYEAVAKLLLETGKIDIDVKDKYGQTPLSLAAERGHEAVVKLLLKTNKVEVDMKDGNGRTPLWHAAKRGHEAVVKLLLEIGKVEVDMKDEDGQTPLWYAVEQGHEAVIKLLLEMGKADVDVRDKYGRTPLEHAAMANRGRRRHEGLVRPDTARARSHGQAAAIKH